MYFQCEINGLQHYISSHIQRSIYKDQVAILPCDTHMSRVCIGCKAFKE